MPVCILKQYYYKGRIMQANIYQKDSRKFAMYPGAGTGNNDELSYLALGLGNEAGEVQGKIKKILRDGTYDPQAIAMELGDTMWYIAQLAWALGYDLENIMDANYGKLQGRQERGTIQGSGDNR